MQAAAVAVAATAPPKNARCAFGYYRFVHLFRDDFWQMGVRKTAQQPTNRSNIPKTKSIEQIASIQFEYAALIISSFHVFVIRRRADGAGFYLQNPSLAATNITRI